MTWNFGDILDALPNALPADAPAFIHGNRTITWGETSHRSNNLARAILARGAKPGDKVAMSTTLAGRDPEAWPDAGHVVLSRKPQHLSFASGPHLGLGMNLARRELLVAISEFLAAIPPFQLKPRAEMEFHLGMIQPLALPLVWSR